MIPSKEPMTCADCGTKKPWVPDLWPQWPTYAICWNCQVKELMHDHKAELMWWRGVSLMLAIAGIVVAVAVGWAYR